MKNILAMPVGVEIVRSASSSIIRVLVKAGRLSSFQMERGISDEEDNNDDDGDTDDNDGNSDNHDDDSDDERTESDKEEIHDPNLTNVDQTKHEEEDVDDRVHTPSDYELTDDEKIDDEETMDDEEDDKVIKELYEDANMNLGNENTKMTDANQGASEQQNVSQESGFEQVEEDAHLLNLENPYPADNEIASLMETSARHATVVPEITSGFTTTIPPSPPFINLLRQQQTPTSTTTTTNPTMTLPEIPNFASLFKFDQRVDSTMKAIIKEQVQAQVSKIMPKIEKYITESLGAEVLVRSTNQPQMSYAVAASLSKFELKKILIDKMETNKSIGRSDTQKNIYNDQDKDEDPFTGSDRGTKRRKSGKDAESSKVSRSKERKSSSTSKDASQSQHKSFGKSAHTEKPSHTVEDSGMQQDQEFITGNNDD
ncbi:hypothetical protein Tco_1361856 [Tanacetum coccineum]